MDIQVKNNNQIVFEGNNREWLVANQDDQEVKEMIEECWQHGCSARYFISGRWSCMMI